jgi:putative nucleotidyltransferase with HDIG domain
VITEKVATIIDNIEEFSTLPTVYASLADVLADPRSTAQDVSNTIACDQASTSKVLKIVNSPFYGFPGQIDSLSRAVVILGYNEIFNLILTSYLMDFFSKKNPLGDFRPVDFWGHSIGVGIATKYLGQVLGITDQENFFIAGVLHDIGKLVFFEFAEDQFSRALELSQKNCQTLREAEEAIFGLDHAQTGALVGDRWGLPRSIVEVIRFHETGMVPGKTECLAATVHLGNIVARALELGHPGDDFIPRPNPMALQILNLNPGSLKKIVPHIIKDYEEICRVLL